MGLATSSYVQYAYDSQNKRIFASPYASGGQNVPLIYFYGVDGNQLGVYQWGFGMGECYCQTSLGQIELFTYFGSRRVGTIMPDRLDSYGQYYPWGEDKAGNNPADTWSYATYWRDSFTGLDYANQRYYSNVLGRFITPDPYLSNVGGAGDPSDPGSWNKYPSTRSDPVNRYDPMGTSDCPTGMICAYLGTNPNLVSVVGSGIGSAGGGAGGGASNAGTAIQDKGAKSTANYSTATSQAQAQCVNSFTNSSLGALVKFFSLINLITDFGNAWIDWTLLPAAKAAALQVLQYLSNTVGSTEFLSVAGAPTATTITGEFAAIAGTIEAASGPGLLLIPFAAAVDAGVFPICTQVPNLRFFSQ